MQIDRLFKIIYLLMDKRQIKAKELAERLEVSVRTIYRDIETLSGAGIPVYSVAGRGGGITLMEHFVLNKSTVSDDEQTKILAALQNLSAADYMDTDDVFGKMSSFFQKPQAKWIEVDYSRWSNTTEDRDRFEEIKQAILSHQRIRFTYYDSYGKESQRKIDPVKLVFKDKTWYLQGYCHSKEDYRVFRLSRIHKLEVLEEMYEGDHDEIPPINQYEKDMDWTGVPVKLKFQPQAAYRLYDEFRKEDIRKQDDGTYVVKAELTPTDAVFDYLLTFGDMLEVLEPTELKERFLDRLKKILAIYKT